MENFSSIYLSIFFFVSCPVIFFRKLSYHMLTLYRFLYGYSFNNNVQICILIYYFLSSITIPFSLPLFFQMLRQHRTHFPLKVYQIVWRNSSDVYSAFIFLCYNPFLNYKNYFCMDHIQLFFIFELRQFYVELLFAQYSKSNNASAFFFMFSSYNLYAIIQLCSGQAGREE